MQRERKSMEKRERILLVLHNCHYYFTVLTLIQQIEARMFLNALT